QPRRAGRAALRDPHDGDRQLPVLGRGRRGGRRELLPEYHPARRVLHRLGYRVQPGRLRLLQLRDHRHGDRSPECAAHRPRPGFVRAGRPVRFTMNSLTRAIGAGTLAALLVLPSPAAVFADDSDIFGANIQPNVLIMIDGSGSMADAAPSNEFLAPPTGALYPVL